MGGWVGYIHGMDGHKDTCMVDGKLDGQMDNFFLHNLKENML